MRLAKHDATRELLAAWQDSDGPVWAYWDAEREVRADQDGGSRAEPRWEHCGEYDEGAMLVSGIDMEQP